MTRRGSKPFPAGPGRRQGGRRSTVGRPRWALVFGALGLYLCSLACAGYGAESGPTADDLFLPGPDDFLVDVPERPRPSTPSVSDVDRFGMLVREGRLEIQAGNHEASARVFRRALKLSPNDRAVRFSLATSLLAIGEYTESESLFQGLLAENEEDHIILNNLAWLYATSRDIRFRDGTRALAHARRALLLAPSAHYVWSTLAESYYVSGQYPQAVRAAEQAVHLAREMGAEEAQRRDYQRLLDKCRQAARAFEILD